MDEPNAECTSIPGRSWPGANLYKSLKLGWHCRRLRWAVVAASEAAQGHEANGLPAGSREFQTLFNEVASKVHPMESAIILPSSTTLSSCARRSQPTGLGGKSIQNWPSTTEPSAGNSTSC
jgi:hypothetical protein